MRVLCRRREDTEELGKRLGSVAEDGLVIALKGDLGAGKTTFVQGLAAGLGVPASRRVTSPTFAIAHEHPGRLSLYHIDLYRVDDFDELYELGVSELVGQTGVAAVEWAERCPNLLPDDRFEIDILTVDEGRLITLSARGPRTLSQLQAILPMQNDDV